MKDLKRGRRVLLPWLLLLAVIAAPLSVLAEGGELEATLAADAYVRDTEIVLLNRNDGHVVIRDYAVGPNMQDLSGKYDQWGGPYNLLAAGDFNGDGTREIVVAGGRGVEVTGPNLNTFDPIVPSGSTAVPNLAANIDPFNWTMLQAGDVDGDGRDEIVAVRETNEPNNVTARVVCYQLEGNVWGEKWSLPTGGAFRDMTLGDFDNDNKTDIGFTRDFRYVLILDGDNPNVEHFSAQIGGTGDWNKILIGDVNADNSRDLVLLRNSQAISGNFPAAVLAIHPTTNNAWTDIFGWGFGDPPEDIALGDWNGDGKPEILAVNTGNFAKTYILNPRMNDTAKNNTEGEIWIGDNEWAPNLVTGDPNGDNRAEFMLIHTKAITNFPDFFLRIWGFHDQGGYADDANNYPFWNNFIASNLDGTGVSLNPTMQVPSTVTLFYETGTSTGTTESIRVRNTSSGSFTWTASVVTGAPWLTMTGSPGTAEGLLTFAVNAGSPPAAGSQAQVRIVAGASGMSVNNGDQTITVNVVVVPQLQSVLLPVTFH